MGARAGEKLVADIFGGELEQCIECKSCGYRSVRKEVRLAPSCSCTGQLAAGSCSRT